MNPAFCIVLFFVIACQSPNTKPQELKVSDSSALSAAHRADTTLFTKEDTVSVGSVYDTLHYSRQEFNEIVKYFPALYSQIPQHPDISYYQSGIFKEITDKDGNKKTISFGSEAGQDQYYILYAYFLRKKNNNPDLSSRRDSLILIYNRLTSIFGTLNYGGTYFGHTYKRIPAYAEYSIYRYGYYKEYYTKKYTIAEQKKLFLNALKQHIIDEVKADNSFQDNEARNQRRTYLLNTADELGRLITDYFFLKTAQEFWHSQF